MRGSRVAKADAFKSGRRMPLTITLDSRNYAFIDSCVALKEFDSVDKLFDAALTFYRRHLLALNNYAEHQIHKGYSRAEILESIECETLVTKVVLPRLVRRRNGSSVSRVR
jgi:hypothetical protein